MELAIFTTTLLITLPIFLLLSISLVVLMKMMGFSKPSVFRMSTKYFMRWILTSLGAALLTTYLASQELGAPDYTYTVALLVGLGVGAVALVMLDVLSIHAED